jgi:ribulose-5-phosphate 4-epimerase/fuculose-1-phosphate aldolase/CheY-like chemotaxis protein
MRQVLIVEDEPSVAEGWHRLINSAVPSQSWVVSLAGTYQDAISALRSERFDAVLSDLLLLPPGYALEDGRLIGTLPTGARLNREFTSKDWDEFVVRAGGVGLIRWIRNAPPQWRTPNDVPVIATSFFDAFPGFQRIVRMLTAHKRVLVVPKFFKSPESPDFGSETGGADIRAAAVQGLQRFLSGDEVGAEFFANKVRSLLFQKSSMWLHAKYELADPSRKLALVERQKTHAFSFTLVARFDTSGDSKADRLVAQASDFYPLSKLYEEWELLRDNILMNPDVRVSFELHIKQRPEATPTAVIPLPWLSEAVDGTTAHAENKARSVLRHRAVFVFLANASEPPQGFAEHGWTIHGRELLAGAMANIEDHPHIRRTNGPDGRDLYVMDWHDTEIKVNTFFESRDGEGAYETMIKTLRERLDASIEAHYRNDPVLDGPPVRGSHIIVNPRGASGYYFNGDLELVVERGYQLNPEIRDAVLFHHAMAETQIFECVEGDAVDAGEIKDRLLRHFPGKVKTVTTVDEVVREGRKGDILACVPADGAAIDWWFTELRSGQRVRQLARSGVRIVLVPSSDAANNVPPEVFQHLEREGIHCVYTKGYTAIPEAKIVDAIICTGPRVKYVSRVISDVGSEEVWGNAVSRYLPLFRRIYETSASSQILGDHLSGSASVRLDQGICLVTSSRTDKLSLTDRDLTHIRQAGLAANEIEWTGARRPTSGSPWHAYLYGAFPQIKAILHTHNKTITYSPAFDAIRTRRYVRYGTVEIGQAVEEILRARESEFAGRAAILNGHGEVIVGDSLDECVATLHELHNTAAKALELVSA